MPETEALARDLEDAAMAVRNQQPHRAAWRVADAGGQLRKLLEKAGCFDLAGFDQDTGLGYRLPEKRDA